MIPPKTQFAEVLVRSNALTERGFHEWTFYPGMLFLSRDKWWGDWGKRDRPHEGVDLRFYRDREGIIQHLPETPLSVPALYDGTVVNVLKDYIGTSLFVCHDIYDTKGKQLHTIYGHTDPVAGMGEAVTVRAGSIIATIADAAKKKAKMSSHLHLSIAWISPGHSHELLNWDMLSNHNSVVLVNPLPILGCPYSLVDP